MVHCAAFGCNANSSKHRATHHFFQFPTDPVLLKKWIAKIKRANFKPTKHSRLCSAHFEKNCFDRDPEMLATLGYPGARISLKSDAVPTIFPAVEAALMPSIRRRQASARAGSTAALPESKASGSRKRCSSAAGSAAAVTTAGSATTPMASLGYQVPSTSGEFTRSAYRKRQRIKVILTCYIYYYYSVGLV